MLVGEIAGVWWPALLGGEWRDKGGHLAGRTEEHIVVERWEDRTAHGGGHEAEGMGVRAGCKGGV